MKLPVYNWSAFEQSVLDIAIKVGVFCGLIILNVLSSVMTGWQLPDPAVTLPVLTLVLSQLDSLFVAWAQKENVPVPPSTPTA